MNNTDWIEELSIKRRSLFSTVIIVESEDREREKELVTHLRKFCVINGGTKEKLYLFDMWKGLFKYPDNEDENEPEQITPEGGSGLLGAAMGGQPKKMSLPNALNTMDGILKDEKSVLILSGLIEEDKTLNAFIKSIAQDDGAFNSESSTVVIVSNLLTIPAQIRALCSIVTPPTSTPAERRVILEEIVEQLKVDTEKIDMQNIIDLTSGLNLNQTEATILESIYRTQTVDSAIVTKMKAELIQRSGVLEVDMNPKYGFEAVGGYEVIKDFITESMVKVYQNSEQAKALGLPMPRGIMLFGMGGTGKTILAKAIAREMNLPFVKVRFDMILGGIVGESEKNMALVLRTINDMSPCMVFIDEIDQLGQRQSTSTDSGVNRRLFSRLLEALGEEDRQWVIIGATNEPEHLDTAFLRVGRFDYNIPQLLPDIEGRKAILKVHTEIKNDVPLAKGVNFDTLAQKTDLWTGAELRELVIRAIRGAFKNDAKKVTMKHFESALESFSVNKKARKEDMEKYMKIAKDMTNDTQFLNQLESGYKKTMKTKAELLKSKQ